MKQYTHLLVHFFQLHLLSTMPHGQIDKTCANLMRATCELREGQREGGREGGRERKREGEKEGGRERGRESTYEYGTYMYASACEPGAVYDPADTTAATQTHHLMNNHSIQNKYEVFSLWCCVFLT